MQNVAKVQHTVLGQGLEIGIPACRVSSRLLVDNLTSTALPELEIVNLIVS
jgi:hypothetical protein